MIGEAGWTGEGCVYRSRDRSKRLVVVAAEQLRSTWIGVLGHMPHAWNGGRRDGSMICGVF